MLSEEVRGRILRAATAARQPGVALVVVFADRAYRDVLRNWIVHANAAGVSSPLLVAMGGASWRGSSALGTHAIDCPYDGSYGDLLAKRLYVLQTLAENGIDFIHSDADAIWLEKGIEEHFATDDADLVFSQGTIWPPDVLADWGFVLCCGLFGGRAGAATAGFLGRVAAEAAQANSDQAIVNRMLKEAGTHWTTNLEAGYTLRHAGLEFTCRRAKVYGSCASLNLRLTVLPHHLFQRLPMADERRLLLHPLSPKDAEEKRAVLRRLGCWALDP